MARSPAPGPRAPQWSLRGPQAHGALHDGARRKWRPGAGHVGQVLAEAAALVLEVARLGPPRSPGGEVVVPDLYPGK
jgi:hypothetical protein